MSLADALDVHQQKHEDAANGVESMSQEEIRHQKRLTVDVGADGIEFSGLVTTEPIKRGEYAGAFAKVFELADLDPAEYEIVGDTVRFSSWQQSARAADGSRDVVTLYAYRASFRRVSEADHRSAEVAEKLIAGLDERLAAMPQRLIRRTVGKGLGPSEAYTVLFSDWQIGKSAIRTEDIEHGTTGPEQTVWRIERAIERAQSDIECMRRRGRNIDSVALFHLGDPTEGVSDSHEGQTFDIQLNSKDQIMLALRMMLAGAEALLPLADNEAHMAFVLCNHGQLSRKRTKTNVTDDADNVQNLLAETMRDIVLGPRMPGITWTLPGQEMIVTPEVVGVQTAAAHGHKMPKDEIKWLQAQNSYLTSTRDVTPRLWLTAHRHSQDVMDIGTLHRIQAATADGGSKWYTDGTGIYSTPATTRLVIGNHDERGFSDVELI